MPSKQSHRGKHPRDGLLFSDRWIPVLREAVRDLSFLFTRGYSGTAALKIVGDHYQLATRQRRAVLGAACGDTALMSRAERELVFEDLSGCALAIDGYNLLIAVESALSGGLLLRGRDECLRDLASIHGSYRKVQETVGAIRTIAGVLESVRPASVTWYFDAPVSNSGRLKALLDDEVRQVGWTWRVELSHGTDKVLEAFDGVVATSDSWILDRAKAWTNLAGAVVTRIEPPPAIIDLSVSG